MGKRANTSLAKDGLNSICVHAMPAGRLPNMEGLAVIEIIALMRLVICRYSVAIGMGINTITVVPSKEAVIQKYGHCFLKTVGLHA